MQKASERPNANMHRIYVQWTMRQLTDSGFERSDSLSHKFLPDFSKDMKNTPRDMIADPENSLYADTGRIYAR